MAGRSRGGRPRRRGQSPPARAGTAPASPGPARPRAPAPGPPAVPATRRRPTARALRRGSCPAAVPCDVLGGGQSRPPGGRASRGSTAQRIAVCRQAATHMTALLSIWAWVEIALVVLLGFLVQTALFVVCLPFDRGRLVAGRTFRLVGVVAAKLNPFWRFGVVGPLPTRPPRRTVVVGNHESNADPFLVSFLPWEMKWLGKAS